MRPLREVTLTFGFSASRTARNKCCLNDPVCGICYSSLGWASMDMENLLTRRNHHLHRAVTVGMKERDPRASWGSKPWDLRRVGYGSQEWGMSGASRLQVSWWNRVESDAIDWEETGRGRKGEPEKCLVKGQETHGGWEYRLQKTEIMEFPKVTETLLLIKHHRWTQGLSWPFLETSFGSSK